MTDAQPTAAQLQKAMPRAMAAFMADVDALAPEQWTTRSLCPDYDALDLVIHLALGTSVHTRMIENGLTGRFEPPWAATGSDPKSIFEDEYRRLRAGSVEVAMPALREAIAGYLPMLDRVTDADLPRRCWFFGFELPLVRVVQWRLFEFLIHRTDLRVPLGKSPAFEPWGLRSSSDFTLMGLPFFISPQSAPDLNGLIDFRVNESPIRATITGGAVSLAEPTTAAADATVESAGEGFVLAAWGRQPLADIERRGDIRFTGDADLARRVFAAIKTP